MYSYLDRFLKTKRIEGCTEKTLNAYQYEIARFLDFIKNETKRNPSLKDLNQEKVEDWLANGHIENTTRARMLSSLKSFSRFLNDRDLLKTNPLEKLKTPRIRKKTISFLTTEEFQTLLRDAKNDSLKIKTLRGRDYAILALFIGSGIRISELRGLKMQNVDLKAGQIKITRKGGKEQWVPIGEGVKKALSDWLECRNELKINPKNQSLFLSNRMLPMSVQTIRDVVKKWMKRTGLWGKKMSPHTLRHSYATAQIAAGTPVQIVQELLGHNQLNTTSKYLHIVNEEYKKAANKIKF